MSAQIIDRTETGFTVQITIPYDRSMLDFEETLQHQLNTAGVLATQEGLRQFDTDGSPITVGSIKLTSKGPLPKDYQTPYGVATVERQVYQSRNFTVVATIWHLTTCGNGITTVRGSPPPREGSISPVQRELVGCLGVVAVALQRPSHAVRASL
jgi:hypothetical protein